MKKDSLNSFSNDQNLKRTRDALLTNHQEVQQHKDCDRPRQHKGMQAIEAGQCRLTDRFTASHEFNHVEPTTGIAPGTPDTIFTAQ
jgi:hypothetical protein